MLSSVTSSPSSSLFWLLKLSTTTAIKRLSVTKVPSTTNAMKYAGAPWLPQHSPMAQSLESSQPLVAGVIMQSYMTEFHASPVTIRSSKSNDWPKFLKFACSFRFSPNFTLPNRFIPRMAKTKHNRNRSEPMLIRPGTEINNVLKSIRKPLSLRMSLKILARRSTRNTEAEPLPPKPQPRTVMKTQKKSKQFHLSAKYT